MVGMDRDERGPVKKANMEGGCAGWQSDAVVDGRDGHGAQRRPVESSTQSNNCGVHVGVRRGRDVTTALIACSLLSLNVVMGTQKVCFAGAGQGCGFGLVDHMARAGSMSGRAACPQTYMASGEGGNSEKFLNSRRLASWVDKIGDGESKLLGSRRVARGVFQVTGRSPSVERVQKEEVLVVAPLSETSRFIDQTAEMVEKAEKVESIGLASADVATHAQDAPREEQVSAEVPAGEEWGTIFAAGESPPRPTEIEELTAEDEQRLLAGERVQKQKRTGRVGKGMVVVDVRADISTVFAVLTDLERYTERISTVRKCRIYERGTKVAKATFSLSRFMLEVNTVLRCERDANTLKFELDKDKSQLIMEEAKGMWFLEESPDRGGEWTRVWLTSEVTCSPLLPTFLVDYAASRALPRATQWLKPTIEAIAEQLPEGAVDVRDARVEVGKISLRNK